ncbi:MAG: ABC transporter permease [Propionibacteriaceae bacterium]|nr:ABC transporter permease [Propionibacteriaceae bacterium]
MTRQSFAWARALPVQPSSLRLIGLAVAVWLVLSLCTPMFNSVLNYQSMAFQVAEVGLFALVIALSMLTSGIDLSIVSVANLSAIVTAKVFVATGATNGGIGALLLGVAAGLLVGAVCGLVNGLIITRLNVSPILATLGTMQLFNGIAVGWTNGEAVYGMPPAFLALGSGTVFGVPTPFIVFVAVAALIGVLIARSGLGFRIRMSGANEVASRFAGVPTRAVLVKAYLLCGLIAAVAGMVVSARTASANADYGQSYVLLAIVIAVLGGTDPNGGRTSIPGVALAAIVLQMVASGFNLLGLSQFTYQIAQGVILIAVMGLATLTGRLHWRRILARPFSGPPTAPAEPTADPAPVGRSTTPIAERQSS